MIFQRNKLLKMINLVSVICFVLCCYHSNTVESEAVTNENGALIVVDTEVDDDDEDGVVTVETDEDKVAMDVFYPTEEWQSVKKGQAVPAGLHIRLNLETGSREAKLMDGDDGMKFWKQGDRQGMVNAKAKQFTRDELKKALKDFKSNKDDVQDQKIIEESLKKKFRSYDELKKDFEKMNMAIKTDFEIITELLNRLQTKNLDVESKKIVLIDLEYYLHQIDNAVVFSDMGGLDVLGLMMNDTDLEIKKEAALTMGSALQSNPKVQVTALASGCLHQMLRMLSIESSLNLRKKVLYALSALIRNFPYAQQKFLENGGLDALFQLFKQSGAEQLQIKAITLLNDLLTEEKHVREHSDVTNTAENEKLRQYTEVKLEDAMIEHGWCDLIPGMLAIDDHDTREKVLLAMSTLATPCKESFKKAHNHLTLMLIEYQDLAATETANNDGDYFSQLFVNVKKLSEFLNTKDEL